MDGFQETGQAAHTQEGLSAALDRPCQLPALLVTAERDSVWGIASSRKDCTQPETLGQSGRIPTTSTRSGGSQSPLRAPAPSTTTGLSGRGRVAEGFFIVKLYMFTRTHAHTVLPREYKTCFRWKRQCGVAGVAAVFGTGVCEREALATAHAAPRSPSGAGFRHACPRAPQEWSVRACIRPSVRPFVRGVRV